MRSLMARRLLCSASVTTLLAFAAAPALAQDQAKAQQAAPAGTQNDASGPDTSQDIVVTAQFRSERLQDTPLAISAVNGSLAAARSQVSIADIAKTAPSVNIEPSANGGGPSSTIFIRGIGQSDSIPAVEPGVGVYIDDVYYGILTGSNFDLLDIDRVEILRGPQGTLSGKNSEGGSIKLYNRQPTNDPGGYAEFTYGSFNRSQARGAVNIPIVDDKILLRVGGVYRHVRGFLDRLDYGCVNPGTVPQVSGSSRNDGCRIGREGGQDLAAIRATLRLNLSERLHDTISFDRISDHQESTPSKLIYSLPLWTGGLDFTTPAKSYSNYSTFTGQPFTANQYTQPARNDVDQWGISNVLDWELSDNLSIKSITAYRKSNTVANQDGDASPYNVFLQNFEFNNKQFTQELRLSGSLSSVLDWTVGGFYYHSDLLNKGYIDIAGGLAPGGGGVNLAFITRDPIKSESTSGFAHGVVHITDKLNVTGGLRYTDESKDYTFVRLSPTGGTADFRVAGLNGTSSRYSGSRWDYRVAVDYRWSPSLMTYAQVATGFKGGGINPRPYFPTQAVPFKPEKVISYEAGTKADLFDRKVRLSADAFYTDFSDIQLTVTQCDSLSPFPGAPCTQTTNAGNAKLWGAEIEGDIRPVGGLSINFAASLIDFKYKSVNPLTGIPLDADNPFLSKTKLSGGIQYEIPLFGGTVTPRLDVDYRSGFATEALPTLTDIGRVSPRTLLNARLTYRSEDRSWELSGGVTNLTDKFYYASRFDRSGPPFFTALGIVGRPREWSVSVKRNF